MILFCLIRVNFATPQLNPIQSQPFYQQLDDLFDINGFSVMINTIQTLGFEIQGGLLSSTLNPQNIFTDSETQQQILSTSLSQNNSMVILNLDDNYYLLQLQINYQGQISQRGMDLNLSESVVNCSEISSKFLTIIHCYYLSSGQVMLQIQNQSNWVQYNTSILLNNTGSLIQINVEQFLQINSDLKITLIYTYSLQAIVLWSVLRNNTLENFQWLCSLNGNYIQIISTYNNQVFALQDNLILYIINNTQQVYYNQQSSNYISFAVEKISLSEFVIYAATSQNLGVISFNNQFKLIQIYQFPSVSVQAQIFKSSESVLVITDQFALYFITNQKLLQLKYFEQINLYGELNQYLSSSKCIIQITASQLLLYQFQNYFLYNQSPQQSGFIEIGFYNFNGSLNNLVNVYINLLPQYTLEILPQDNSFNGYNLNYSNTNFFDVSLSKDFVGPNISYSINGTNISGFNSIYMPFNFDVRIDNYCFIYPLTYINAFLLIAITSNQIQFYANKYSFLYDNVQSVWKYEIGQIETIIYALQVIENQENKYLVLVITSINIFVYEVIPLINAELIYEININDILNQTSYTLVNSFIKGSVLFIQTEDQMLLIDINTHDFKVLRQWNHNFTFVSSNNIYPDMIFATNLNELLIFQLQDDLTFNLINQIQVFDYQESFQLFAYPVYDGVYLVYTNSTYQYVGLYSMNNVMSVNLGQQFYYQVDTTNFTFNSSRMASSLKYFYVQTLVNNISYVNIYQASYQPTNSLYQSIYLGNLSQQQLNNYSNFIVISDIDNYLDYLIVQTNGNFYLLYQIYYVINNFISPTFTPIDQYMIANTIQVNNMFFQEQYQLLVNILQPQILIQQNQQYPNITVSEQDWINGTLLINPYEYFSGIIQNYTIQCPNCTNINYSSILNDNYYYYDQVTYFSIMTQINDTSYLVLSDQQQITLFGLENNSQQSQNVSNLGINLITYPSVEYQIHLLFTEVFSGALSWILSYKNDVYVCSLIINNIVNITLQNITGILNQANYQDGIIQLGMSNSYSCLYFYIQNNSIYITNIIINVTTTELLLFRNPFINISISQADMVFGTIMQDGAYCLFIIIINATFYSSQNIILNSYKIEYLQYLNQYNYPFHIQSILQYGENTQNEDVITLHLVYSNSILARTISMSFNGMNTYRLQNLCNINIINSTIESYYQNFLSINDYQLAIMNEYPYEGKSLIYLSFYIIDTNLCEKQIQPYTYIQLQNNGSEDIVQVNYISDQYIIISFNQNTTIYQVQKYVQISYQTQQNSTINMVAMNNVSNSTQNINILFSWTPDIQEPSTQFKLYWIIIISVTVVVVILILVWLILKKYNKKNHDPDKQLNSEQNQLEINLMSQ